MRGDLRGSFFVCVCLLCVGQASAVNLAFTVMGSGILAGRRPMPEGIGGVSKSHRRLANTPHAIATQEAHR